MSTALYLLVFVSLVAGDPTFTDEIPILKAKDLPNGTIITTEYFAGEALYGYIDGGADLYLEYGFRKLGRQEIVASNEQFVVDIYQMSSPTGAFGIFSVLRSRCSPIDSLTPNSCQSRYQLQGVVGGCYVSIVNQSASLSAQRLSIDLFRLIQSRGQEAQVEFPALFRKPRFMPDHHRLMIIRGTLGLQNGFADWEPLFKDTRQFSLTILPLEKGEERLSLAHIRFQSAGEVRTFQKAAGFNQEVFEKMQKAESRGLLHFAKRMNDLEIIFIESTPDYPDLEWFLRL